jgi:D-alanine-D-alanine ligase
MRVAVCFGGPSVEHDVSIITAHQLMHALEERHVPVPVYLARDGRMWTGDALRDVEAFGPETPSGAEPCELRIGASRPGFVAPASSRLRGDRDLAVEVVICAIHGTGGEDGTLLGALEHTALPYVGGGVGPAAVAMDKALAKTVFEHAGLTVLPHELVTREMYSADADRTTARVVERIGVPCYAKPLSLGSSIGVSRCANEHELLEALELCLELDRRALVEPALDDAVEVNAAVLGRPGGDLRVSVLEQPVKGESATLSFEDKYLRGVKQGGEAKGERQGTKAEIDDGGMAGQDRLIPAPIPESLAQQVRGAAARAHAALGFAGVVRYDFLIERAEHADPHVVLNEANTVPGSFSFYLFQPDGLGFPDLADALIEIAIAEAAERRATTRTFESALLPRQQGRAA